MTAQNDAGTQAAGSAMSPARAAEERGVRWVYLWLLFSSLFMVPSMVLGILNLQRLERRFAMANPPWDGDEPSWSPDGQQIAFVSRRSGMETIYIMNADGSAPYRLLPEASSYATDYDPDWSPDGRRIAYSSNRSGNYEIYTADVAPGSAPGMRKQLTNNPGRDENPSWSPDGQQIAFWSDRTGDRDIYAMKADGSHVRNMAHDQATDMWPDWSPDGQYVAFNSDRSGNDVIYIMDKDGQNVHRVADEFAQQEWPRWSPDGRALAFHAETDEGWDIVVLYLGAGGSTRTVLTKVGGSAPAWSPDGDRIAFTRREGGSRGVYVMAPDGSGVVDLTARLSAETLPPNPVSTPSYIGAVASPSVLLLVLLLPMRSRLVYVRRHAQQGLALAAARLCSTVLIVGLSRGELIGLWVVINGGLWIFGTTWGLRQIRLGECWLMRRRGEGADLPRAWAARQALPQAAEPSSAHLPSGERVTEQEDRQATIERLRLAFRTGSPQERQKAIDSLQAMGEIEDF